MLQILVDSVGNGCVLSHTDNSKSAITTNVIKRFNEFRYWTPAKNSGKAEGRTSINVLVEIKAGTLTAQIMRVDINAFKKSFDKPNSPQIYNKDFKYLNEHLNSYDIKVWNSKNSNLPDNFNDHIAIDNNNGIWLTIDEGLVRFDGKTFQHAEQNITARGNYFSYYALSSANNNTTWVCGKGNIYSYNNGTWTLHEPKLIGFKGAGKIVNNKLSNEIFFCTSDGLIIYKNGTWNKIDQVNVKSLPSNRVTYAKKDSKNRIWIGTYSGSVLIDENGKATNFNETQSVLKGKCITSVDEDENGNVFLGLYEYDRKDKEAVNNDEGIAIVYKNGEIKQFTTNNSGMPFNHVTKVLYDKTEHVLWIATDRAGLVRYDLKSGWENYHNDNSAIPTSYISDMEFDNNGTLYLATRQGLVKVERK
ncbi:ligand-binding sensor domain-containing protein [Mucilaginibacter lacusdianchii]|uniref:ligand-binding sensor domain-containing protein n=1 Tax=Mucilaginibacter lacusdianchii TaxID=2684211 RepID=UPI00131C3FD2|nr:two-component regulator propeller domain-containing protein [Mucilaginibacter sp. JXJ CY 39]